MALFDTVGEIFGFSDKKTWTLEMIDKPNTKYIGQFMAENAVENIGARLNSQESLNTQTPNRQWVGGESETFQFEARIYARDSLKDVAAKITQLKSFARKRDDLGRAPMFIFTFGTQLSFTCFVKSLGGIKYDELRSDGTLRGASFTIILEKLDERAIDGSISLAAKIKSVGGIISSAVGLAAGVGLVNIPGGSLHTIGRTVRAKDGDTFEGIAQKEYGDALIGDVLRRANPDIANIEANDEVILVDKREIFTINVTPQSNSLKDSTSQNQLRQQYLEKRGKEKKVFIRAKNRRTIIGQPMVDENGNLFISENNDVFVDE